MALSANTVWEVRTAGADTNGGGFVTGAAGTDWSQQNAAQYNVADGITAGTTTITSATANFGTDVVGNLIYVQGGTGSVVAAWYQIISRTNSTTIVVDRSTGLSAGTGVTLTIGGALGTVGQAATNMSVSGMNCYIKADGTYTLGAGVTFTNGTTSTKMSVIGYTTTRTDSGRATLQATAAITMVTNASGGYAFRNLILDGNSATGTNAFLRTTAGGCEIHNCKIQNWSGYGMTLIGNESVVACEVTGCATTAGITSAAAGLLIAGCYIHDNTVPGILCSGVFIVVDSIISGNSGASSDGLQVSTNVSGVIEGCVFFNNGRDGIRIAGGLHSRPIIMQNNILSTNSGYGINQVGGSSTLVLTPIRNNAYYNNTTAARFGFAAEDGAVTLTGDPFTNAAGADFSLNSTAGAGTACKAVGRPGSVTGTSTVGYRDIGTAQHADPAPGGGGSGGFFIQ